MSEGRMSLSTNSTILIPVASAAWILWAQTNGMSAMSGNVRPNASAIAYTLFAVPITQQVPINIVFCIILKK
jgi:hypothetical protein